MKINISLWDMCRCLGMFLVVTAGIWHKEARGLAVIHIKELSRLEWHNAEVEKTFPQSKLA